MTIPRNRKLDKYLGYCLVALLLPITRLTGILMRRDHTLQRPPQNILFIKLLGLGSLIVATDAITDMRRKFPGARFILLTDANIADGIKPFGVFDDVWAIHTGRFSLTCFTSFTCLLRSWKLRRLWVIDLEVYSKLTTVYALMTFALNRFGFFLSPVFFRKYLNTHNVLFNQSALLEDNYAGMAQAATGNEVDSHEPRQYSVTRQKEYSKHFIILNNTCSDLAHVRKLPDATFAHICSWILEHTHYRLALAGSSQDKAGIDRFIDQQPFLCQQKSRINNIAGAFSFPDYYRFLSEKGVMLVTIDSGPLHIARKLGLPTVSVWGPTDPGNYLKIYPGEEKRHLVNYQPVPCSPCIHRYEQLPCGGKNVCMQMLSSADIIKNIQTLLEHLKEEQAAAMYKNQLHDVYQTGK
jgi:ADP-heptose:LPS heptosyltransferase